MLTQSCLDPPSRSQNEQSRLTRSSAPSNRVYGCTPQKVHPIVLIGRYGDHDRISRIFDRVSVIFIHYLPSEGSRFFEKFCFSAAMNEWMNELRFILQRKKNTIKHKGMVWIKSPKERNPSVFILLGIVNDNTEPLSCRSRVKRKDLVKKFTLVSPSVHYRVFHVRK